MPTFLIRTLEYVEGTYQVKADSVQEARAKLSSGPPIDWEGVEQTEYACFEVKVESVTELGE